MFFSSTAGYTGKQLDGGFAGYIAEDSLYGVLSIEEGVTEEEGNALLALLRTSLTQASITSLADFEDTISQLIIKHNFPAHISLAVGYLLQNILYIKTVGKGQVYFRRSNDFDLLMSGDKSASGYVKDYDCAVFTTDAIHALIGDTNDIKLFVDMYAPKDIVEKIQNEEYDEEERGFVVLFTEFTSQQSSVGVTNISIPEGIISSVELPPTPQPSLMSKLPKIQFGKSKSIALALAAVLFAVLTWSVVFGYQRRAAAQLTTKVEETQKDIESTLSKAKEESFLDMENAQKLIDQAKNDLESLKKDAGDKKQSEIKAIEQEIQNAEASILKKEEKQYEEFYDLSLENKEAQGTALHAEDKNVAMLDAQNKTIYVLDLGKKSIEKYTSSDLSGATLVSLYDGDVFFFTPKKGVFRFTSENKVKNLIPVDKEWGKITDMQIYNANIYLLDTGTEELYKYTAAESGYSDKASYITDGSSQSLSEATGITIDSAVYIANGEEILKYVSGAAEKFATDFPDKSRTLSGVYTNPDIEQVYTWDKKKGILFILDKKGAYDRQLQSSIITKSSGIFVQGSSAYILAGSKLYTISLE